MKKCPVDQTTLKALMTTIGVEVDYCPTCLGMWLDKEELFAFSKTATYIREKLSEAYEQRKPTDRLSPITGQPMVELTVFDGSVVVDYCVESGGIWLDKMEITKFPVELKIARGESTQPVPKEKEAPGPSTKTTSQASPAASESFLAGSFGSFVCVYGLFLFVLFGVMVFLSLPVIFGGFAAVTIGVILFVTGMRVVRPTHCALIERFGKYSRFADSGLHWIIPVIDHMFKVNVTEIMIDAQPQEIITDDNLNARVDAQIYFRIGHDETSVKNSQYNVNNIHRQIISLTRSTLRNIIGTLTLKVANGERSRINEDLLEVLREETSRWGIQIVRTELKEIDPPKDVQETMNKVVKAENEKIAAVDYATAAETEADGQKRSEIKKAEGVKQGNILKAEGEAEAIRLVNEAAEKYFIGNAQILRKLETVEKALQKNTKVVVPADGELVNVIGDLAGVTPVDAK